MTPRRAPDGQDGGFGRGNGKDLQPEPNGKIARMTFLGVVVISIDNKPKRGTFNYVT